MSDAANTVPASQPYARTALQRCTPLGNGPNETEVRSFGGFTSASSKTTFPNPNNNEFEEGMSPEVRSNARQPSFSVAAFENQRLAHRDIRVLDIISGPHGQDVVCSTRVVNLDDDAEFETLSYVWGAHDQETSIEVSGQRVDVTPNLYAALQRLRHPVNTRTIWIDQLCINQQDNDERASQVSMMRDIYRRCSGCVVWLGEVSDHSNDLREQDAQAVFDFINFAAYPRKAPLSTDLPVLFQTSNDGEYAREAFEAFAMYGNPWWSRVWTIQEAIIPNSAQLTWGPLSVSRDAVFQAAFNLIGVNMEKIFSQQFCKNRTYYTPLLRRMLYPVHGFRHYLEGEPPLDLLLRWRHRESTNPRDKVYGLLGLLPPLVLPTAAPCSYDISTCSLFEGVTVDLIREENGLRPLLGSSEMPHVTSGLATWAIDFACSNWVGKHQLKWWGHSHRYKKFSASGNKPFDVDFAHKATVLQMQGVLIDRVSDVGDVYMLGNDAVVHDADLLHLIQNAKHILDRHLASQNDSRSYVNGQTWKDAFWRTLTGDWIMSEFPVQRVDDTHEKAFNELMDGLAKHDAWRNDWLCASTPGSVSSPPSFQLGTPTEQLPHTATSTSTTPHAPSNILYESICGMLPDHVFLVTEKGYIGIGPPDTRPGDQIWVLYGGQVPFVLRREDVVAKEGEEQLLNVTLVGDAYIHGIMDGEAVAEGCEERKVWIH